jgi:hypothetical protein
MRMMMINQVRIKLPRPHEKQREFIDHTAKRKAIRAGRRGGKTVGISIGAVEWFLAGLRVLYAAPTMEQVSRFWSTVTRALDSPIKKNFLKRMNLSIILKNPAQNKGSKQKQPGMQILYVEIMQTC